MGTRVEEDLLGQREVPDDKYYGIHALRALENFQISGRSMNEQPEFIRGMVQVKKASALANKLGCCPQTLAQYLAAAKKYSGEGAEKQNVNKWARDLAGALCKDLFTLGEADELCVLGPSRRVSAHL